MLQDVEPRPLEKSTDLPEILPAPGAFEAGRIPEGGPARAARLRVDDVRRVVDAARGEERVAADLDAAVVGVPGDIPESGQDAGVLVLHVQAAAEAEDDHLEAGRGALVDGRPDGRGVGGLEVHEDGILRHPGRDRPVHATKGQAAAFPVGRVEQEFVGHERHECAAGRDVDFRTDGRARFEKAGGFQLIVDLRSI